MNMSKKKILLIAVALVIVAVGIIAAVASKKEKEMDPEEILQRFEKAAEEVLGEDIQRVSQTELVATLTYSHETDKDNNIYYRVLKTTYFEAGDPTAVTGLNTEALNVLFPVDMMDSCEEMMIQDWHGALYKKDDTAYLCFTCDPEVTYVLEYTPSKMSDADIIKMAESVEPIEEE
jgi:uncharacterized membrane protein YvbJ